MSASRYVHLDVDEVIQVTPKAIRVRLESGAEHWIPKSQISDADQYVHGDRNCTVSVTEWFAEKEGIES